MKSCLAHSLVWPLLSGFFVFVQPCLRAADPLPALVQEATRSGDPQFQIDVLRGIAAALKSHRTAPAPQGWSDVETKFAGNRHPEVRALAQSIALKFGSERARAALRNAMIDPSGNLGARRAALDSLLGVRDSDLAKPLQQLLADASMRSTALKGLANYDDANTPSAVLGVYRSLDASERRDALSTLCSRSAYAKPLLAAIDRGEVSVKELSADLIRQLRSLKDAEVGQLLTKVYGVMRESGADKQREIERFRQIYRAGGSTPGDAARGRLVFNKACVQCHTLFEEGGKVGPDITGSSRADLDYILQNIVDPNAVIPNEYRSTSIETKDGRSLMGILKKQDAESVSLATVTETVTLPRTEIVSISQSELSMMPEGLLAGLSEQEVRDLIYYLGRPGQVALPKE